MAANAERVEVCRMQARCGAVNVEIVGGCHGGSIRVPLLCYGSCWGEFQHRLR